MGLFDFLFPEPTIDRFAGSFMRELRRAGCTSELAYDKEQGRITRGTGDSANPINLHNFYRESLTLPRRHRKAHLARAVRAMLTSVELPADFESAREHLRPKVWPRAALDLGMKLQTAIDGGDPEKFDMPQYEIGSHMVASLVYDLPDSMQSLNNEDLEKWGLTYYEALEVARENLETSPHSLAKIDDGFYLFSSGDNYDCCRLLVPTLLAKCDVKGDLIAMAAHRDELFVTGADDDTGLRIMLELAKKASDAPRLIVPIPVRLDGDAWVDWMPAPDHSLAAGFRGLARDFYAQQYADQKEMLDRLHEKNGTEVFVATFAVVEKEDKSRFSYGVWSQGVPTLLPKVDWIAFNSAVDGKFEPAAVASWEKAQGIIGRLMKPTELYPERVHVTDFPSASELAELGMATP